MTTPATETHKQQTPYYNHARNRVPDSGGTCPVSRPRRPARRQTCYPGGGQAFAPPVMGGTLPRVADGFHPPCRPLGGAI